MLHRYRSVSDTQLSQNLFDKILCPNLRTGVRMSMLNPDSEGWVTEKEMRAYLEYIGVVGNSHVGNLLISTGVSAPTVKKAGFVNLTAFSNTFLDHGSSSGILNNSAGFSQARLDLLKSYADSQQKIQSDSLGMAMTEFHRCPANFASRLGTHIASFESAGLLEIFGREGKPKSGKYFTPDDIDSLWKDNRFPDGWQPPKKPFYGTWLAFKHYFLMMLNRVKNNFKH